MKLTTEQEELLVVLVAVEDYKTDKKYKSNELLDKIGDLGMEENGFYMDEQIDDFKALKSNNLLGRALKHIERKITLHSYSPLEISHHLERYFFLGIPLL